MLLQLFTKKEYFSIAVLAAHMERMNFRFMMDKVAKIRELNEMQLNERYLLEREMEIGQLADRLRESGWNEDEKNKLKDYHVRMRNFNNIFVQKIEDFYRIQKELHNQAGNEIKATVSYSDQTQTSTCRGSVI